MLREIKRLRESQKGFTLIELMATLAILAMVVAIAVPAVGKILDNAEAQAEQSSIAMIENAGMNAYVGQLPFDGEGDSYTVLGLISSGYLHLDADDDLNKAENYVVKDSTRNKFIFNGDLGGTDPDGEGTGNGDGEGTGNVEDSDFSGYADGEFKYIGSKKVVDVPHVIKGVSVTSYFGMFEGTDVHTVISDNPNITNTASMFMNSKADTLTVSDFNSSNVTDMSDMFRSSVATQIDVSGLDTSNVRLMTFMFGEVSAPNLDLSTFDTSNVTNMASMFNANTSQTVNLSSFDTSNVTSMRFMFRGTSFNSLKLTNFDTSKVTDMTSMFSATKAQTIDVSSFRTTNVKDMGWMFANIDLYELDLRSFDTSNVTEMRNIVQGLKVKYEMDPCEYTTTTRYRLFVANKNEATRFNTSGSGPTATTGECKPIGGVPPGGTP